MTCYLADARECHIRATSHGKKAMLTSIHLHTLLTGVKPVRAMDKQKMPLSLNQPYSLDHCENIRNYKSSKTTNVFQPRSCTQHCCAGFCLTNKYSERLVNGTKILCTSHCSNGTSS